LAIVSADGLNLVSSLARAELLAAGLSARIQQDHAVLPESSFQCVMYTVTGDLGRKFVTGRLDLWLLGGGSLLVGSQMDGASFLQTDHDCNHHRFLDVVVLCLPHQESDELVVLRVAADQLAGVVKAIFEMGRILPSVNQR
jgi:hypothetical protein